MRRFEDTDEVDAVVVGCGAGGGSVLLQRLACSRMAGGGPGRRALLGSRQGLGQRRGWIASAVLERAESDLAATDPVLLGSNNSGRGVGGSMVHYVPGTPCASTPATSRILDADGVGTDWPLDYADLKPYYERIEQELPVAGEHWPWGDPHSYPHRPHPVGGNGELFLRGAEKLGITAKVGPVAIPNGRFGNRPHCIYRGFCLQGCKVNAKASPLITHIPTLSRTAPRSARTAYGLPHRSGRTHRPGRGCALHPRRPPRFQRARLVIVATTPSKKRPGCCSPPRRSVSRRACATTTTRSADTRSVQGAPQTRQGASTAEVRMYRGPAARGQFSGGVLRDRPGQAVPARLLHPDRGAAADHLGRACRRPGPLGRGPAAVFERLRALVVPRRPVRVPAAGREPRHARAGDGPQRPAGGRTVVLTVRQRCGPDEGGAYGNGGICCTPLERRGHHHRSLRTPGRRCGCSRGRARAAWSTPTAAASPCPTCTSPTAVSCPRRARRIPHSRSWRRRLRADRMAARRRG